MFTLAQSTAWNAPLQAYLSTDHVSIATGKTLAVTISKNGGAYGNPSGGATNATEIANGSYYVGLTTTDTATLGPLFVRATSSGVDDVVLILNVVKATNGGLTALPDTACTTNASLLTSGSGTDQLTVSSGIASADAKKINSQTTSASGTVTFPNATLASTTNITAGTITTVTNLTNAPTAGDFTATMKTSIGTAVAASAVASVTGAVGSISGVSFPTHFSAIAISSGGAVTLDGTSALAEAYSTQGSAFTLSQCLYDMHQFFFAHSTSGTTWDILKRDNSTVAKTATLNSATLPTQLIEAT